MEHSQIVDLKHVNLINNLFYSLLLLLNFSKKVFYLLFIVLAVIMNLQFLCYILGIYKHFHDNLRCILLKNDCKNDIKQLLGAMHLHQIKYSV